MLKKISIFAVIVLTSNFAQASKLPEHEKPAHEEIAPEVKQAKIDQASLSSAADKATTSLAACLAADTGKPASSHVAAACSASGAAEASVQKKTSKTAILDKLKVIPERNLQNIILGYLNQYEPRTLVGHTGTVSGVAWSPDSNYLASGSSDATIKIWNAALGTCAQTLTGHCYSVNSIAWSTDNRLASGSSDETVQIWDMATGKVKTLMEHYGLVHSLAWSPDGEQLVIYSRATLHIWNMTTEQVIRIPCNEQYEYIAWSPDSKQFAIGWRGGIKICNAATGTEVKTLNWYVGSVYDTIESVAWSPDGNFLASGSWETIHIWDVATGEIVKTFTDHNARSVRAISWSPDSKSIVSCAYEGITIWDLITGLCINTLEEDYAKAWSSAYSPKAWSLAYSSDGKYIASGHASGAIKIWQNQAREIESADAASKEVRAALETGMVGHKPLQEIILGYLGLC